MSLANHDVRFNMFYRITFLILTWNDLPSRVRNQVGSSKMGRGFEWILLVENKISPNKCIHISISMIPNSTFI